MQMNISKRNLVADNQNLFKENPFDYIWNVINNKLLFLLFWHRMDNGGLSRMTHAYWLQNLEQLIEERGA